jgi:hypothetical protein
MLFKIIFQVFAVFVMLANLEAKEEECNRTLLDSAFLSSEQRDIEKEKCEKKDKIKEKGYFDYYSNVADDKILREFVVVINRDIAFYKKKLNASYDATGLLEDIVDKNSFEDEQEILKELIIDYQLRLEAIKRLKSIENWEYWLQEAKQIENQRTISEIRDLQQRSGR